jgi:hypothetical protein
MTTHAAQGSPGRMTQVNPYSGGLAVAGAATDARKTSGAAGYAARACELTAGDTADTRETALPTGATARSLHRSTGTTVAAGIAATATRVLLVGHVCRRATHRARGSFRCSHRHHGNRCGSSSTNNNRFDHTEFGHAWRYTPFHTGPKHRISVVMVDDVEDIAAGPGRKPAGDPTLR